MTVTTVEVDTDRDLTFASAVGSLLLDGEIMIGTEDRYDYVFPPNTARLRFSNIGGEFAAFGVERGMRIRIYRGSLSLPSWLFVGQVDDIKTDWVSRRPVMVVSCVSRLAAVMSARISMPVMQDVTADEVLAEIFNRAFEPGQLDNLFYLNYSNVGEAVLGGASSGFEVLAEGLDNIPYIGDTWSETTRVGDMIRDVVTGAGTLYESASGYIYFRNRHYKIGYSSGGLVIDQVFEVVEREAEPLRRVELRINPRSIETDTEVFRQRSTHRLLEGFSDNRLQARHENGQVVAVLDHPRMADLLVLNTFGADITPYVYHTIETDGQTIIVSWQNVSGMTGYVQPGMSISATALIAWDTYNVVVEEERRSDAYGGRTLVLEMPYINDPGVAVDFAMWIFMRESETGSYLHEMRIDERAAFGGQFATGLFQYVEYLGSGSYVVGIRHLLMPGKIKTVWYMRPQNPGQYVVIGRTPYLGYGRLAL